ncbi:Parvovirus coat protein VP1-like protein [Peribacillus sp. FSL H8-0477]|uniref:Parvovirus coat protein VP1-like protein n=1 Tax=Peribacillus sp. FSL H8-0477 TaxID=2921388 RepID=UPI0030F64BAF
MNFSRRSNQGFCVPGYRWCGPGCSGPGAPTNAVDSCCMLHDKCYERFGPTRQCDQQFLNCMRPKINPRTKMGRDADLFSRVIGSRGILW